MSDDVAVYFLIVVAYVVVQFVLAVAGGRERGADAMPVPGRRHRIQ